MKAIADKLDIIIPIYLDHDWPDVEDIVANVKRLNQEYGFTRFAAALPGKFWRSSGLPPVEFFLRKAEFFRQIRKRLHDPEISCGWWITLTARSGSTAGVTRIVKSDGSESPDVACPLDDTFRRLFAERIAAFCAAAHPDFVITEDDYGIGAADEFIGCFCPKHLAEFARRTGKEYSREELLARFLPLVEGSLLAVNRTPVQDLRKRLEDFAEEDLELFRKWWELKRDSLAGCLEYVRKEVDKLTPEIPIGICQSAHNITDGDNTYANARAAAGNLHTPFARIHGTFYGGQDIDALPEKLFNSLVAKQTIKGKFGFYHESDTYPHTQFFSSAAVMKSIMGTAFSYGFNGSLFHVDQMLDKPSEETAYAAMYKLERQRFNAVSSRAGECRVKGVQLVFEPFAAVVEEFAYTAWVKPLAQFGIPYTTEAADTVFISGRQMLRWSDEKIREVMKKQLFLDGEAAYTLTLRNFGYFTGVEVKCADWPMDLDSREVISGKFAVPGMGVNMHRSDTYAPKGRGCSFQIEVTDPACEVITEVLSADKQHLGCGMTRYKNALGGTVTIISQGINGNASSSFFNYRRKKLLLDLLLSGDRSIAFVRNTAKVFLTMNEACDADAPFQGMLTLINLSPDSCENAVLYLPEKWRKCRRFTRLNVNGNWEACDVERTEDGIMLKFPLEYSTPVYITAEK